MPKPTTQIMKAAEEIRCLTLTIWWDRASERAREEKVAALIMEHTGAEMMPLTQKWLSKIQVDGETRWECLHHNEYVYLAYPKDSVPDLIALIAHLGEIYGGEE